MRGWNECRGVRPPSESRELGLYGAIARIRRTSEMISGSRTYGSWFGEECGSDSDL